MIGYQLGNLSHSPSAYCADCLILSSIEYVEHSDTLKDIKKGLNKLNCGSCVRINKTIPFKVVKSKYILLYIL